MKKSVIGLIALFILLTTYTPRLNLILNSNLHIKEIIVENNVLLKSEEIKKKLVFLYEQNLFFLDINDVKKNLKQESFIESFRAKKIYPNTLKLIIEEKEPIAILQKKKQKFYISNKGDLINYVKINNFKDLPIVFGGEKNFYSLYQDLQNISCPLNKIKSFYFFESGRWDLIMNDKKVIKLPIKNHSKSLKNFMISKKNNNLNKYKIFDYRIKNQLILN